MEMDNGQHMNLKTFLALIKEDDGINCNVQGCYNTFNMMTRFIGNDIHEEHWICLEHRQKLIDIMSDEYQFMYMDKFTSK